jgi:putative ATP-dependent endonuclease of the OLD family
MKAYAFYDKKGRKPEENQKFTENFDVANETAYTGIERLLTSEVPVARQWQFLDSLVQAGAGGNYGIPAKRPNDAQVKALTEKVLRGNKGNDFAADLIDLCTFSELPPTFTSFLRKVYADFPKPEPVPVPVAAVAAAAPASAPNSQAQETKNHE